MTGDRTGRTRNRDGNQSWTRTRTQARTLDAADLTLAYVGGGSREWAPKLVQDLALSDLDGEVRLYDVDRESAERNARFGN